MTTGAVTGANCTLACEGDILGGQLNLSLDVTQEAIDASSRDSSRWGESLPGTKKWSISLDAVYIYNDVAKKVIQDHILTGSPATISVIITMPDSATYTGECMVSAFNLAAPYNDMLKMTATLDGTDALLASVS
jgi:predicted secreted protein